MISLPQPSSDSEDLDSTMEDSREADECQSFFSDSTVKEEEFCGKTVHFSNDFELEADDSDKVLVAQMADRLKKFTRISVPLVLSFVSMNVNTESINFVYIGRNVQELEKLSGLGVGNMVLNMLPYAIMLGVNTALETALQKSNNDAKLAQHLYRTILLIFCLFVPIAISFFYVENALTLVGVDKETAGYSKEFITLQLPAVLANAIVDAIDLYLVKMGCSGVVFTLQLLAIPFDLLMCWYFVTILDWSLAGAAMAINLTAGLALLC